MSQPIFQKTFRRVLVAIVLSTALLFVAVTLHVSSEFKDELRSRTSHTAQIVLSLAAAMPLDTIASDFAEQPIFVNDELDYIIAIFQGDTPIYVSPSDLAIPHPSSETSQLHRGAHTYYLMHESDPSTALHVTVGLSKSEAFFSSIEIVLVTVTIFLVATLLMLGLTRHAIRQGLRPIDQLADAVSQRAPNRLGHLNPDQSPTELQPIVLATNALLSRLKDALESERAFAANAAHELRTPLAGILAQSKTLKLEDMDSDAQKTVALIQSSAERSTRQVQQLLDHAFAHSQASVVPFTEFNLADMLRRLMTDAFPSALKLDVEVELKGLDVFEVCLPETLLEIILRNLIDNAIKYCGTGGHVRVTLEAQNPGFQIKVEDSGPGLSRQDFEHAISRFERLGDDAKIYGHGLGLAITRDLCEHLNLSLIHGRSEQLGGLCLSVLSV